MGQRRKSPGRSISDISEGWRAKMLKMNEYYKKFRSGRKVLVRYEDLASNPKKVMKGIFNFLKIGWTDLSLRYWEQEHHSIGGNMGTKSYIWKKQGVKTYLLKMSKFRIY